jgi:hypothetical protein
MIDIEAGEAFVVVFSAIAIIVTLILALAGMRISRDFGSVGRDLSRINIRLDQMDRAEERFNFQSEMLLVLAGDLFKTNALLHAFYARQREMMAAALSRNEDIAYQILLSELVDRNHKTAEHIDFFKVLVAPSEETIDALISKRPTKDTAAFIARLGDVAPTTLQDGLRNRFQALSARIMGIQSYKWTGRR